MKTVYSVDNSKHLCIKLLDTILCNDCGLIAVCLYSIINSHKDTKVSLESKGRCTNLNRHFSILS